MASSHRRKPSSRAALPRRTTNGPLDAPEDPLSVSGTSPISSQLGNLPVVPQDGTGSPIAPATPSPRPAAAVQLRQERPAAPEPTENEVRDLSFLLDASIYHALSQVDVPGPFRKPFLPAPRPDAPLSVSLQQLDGVLAECEYLRAANLAGSILVSGTVLPTDANAIFRLLEVRYSCLELSGNLLMAAQEAKALEDLTSGFYYDDTNADKESEGQVSEGRSRKVPQHIMPFSLRLQASRLQSIGFTDPRRGVSSLYDVGLECREHLSSPNTTPGQRMLWTERLQQVSIEVVNSLIEMGDLDAAARMLESLKPPNGEEPTLWASRMILLRLKMGDLSSAERLIEALGPASNARHLLESLLAVAQDRFEDASSLLSQTTTDTDPATQALVKQNLAVAYLYRGEILRARQLLEELVEAGNSFQTLTINLATIYDLTSDRARELKTSMASRIAGHKQDRTRARSYVNADFKI